MPIPPDSSSLRNRIIKNLEGIKQKYVVLSGKGGVGKTTFSVNLSVALSGLGNRICLLDTDIHGPNVLRLLHLQGRFPEVKEGKIIPLPFNNNLSVVSPAFMQGMENSPIIWRGPIKTAAIKQFLADVQWGTLDYLVVDSPPGTGDEPLTIAQLLPLPVAAILITTPQEVAIDDMRRAASFCQRVGLPVAGIVENMSTTTCPHCNKEISLFKRGGARAAAAELGFTFLGEVPFDSRMVITSDKGSPYIQEYSDAPAALALVEIASKLKSD